eukprot:2825194-Prorocentrum_lima.AAC.1
MFGTVLARQTTRRSKSKFHCHGKQPIHPGRTAGDAISRRVHRCSTHSHAGGMGPSLQPGM